MILKVLFLFSLILFATLLEPAKAEQKATLEVLMVLDYAAYKKSVDAKRGVDLTTLYYSVFQGVKENLEAISIPGYKLEVKLAGLMVAKTRGESTFTEITQAKIDQESVGSYQTLDTFLKWLEEKKYSNPQHNVPVLISGYRMVELPGATYVASVCGTKPASVVEESGWYAMVDQMTHEIAHQLGADEDGINNNCNILDQYIMASQRILRDQNNDRNYDSFSRCSIDSIKKNLDKLKRNNSLCLKAKGRGIDVSPYLKNPIGLSLSLDDQCKMRQGAESFYCAGGGEVERNLCSNLLCWNVKRKICEMDVRQIPVDGTPCGNKMWCKNRRCVRDNKAKPSPQTCIYGDTKGYWENFPKHLSCKHIATNYSSYCYIEPEKCCKTCEKLKKKYERIPQCRYGDQSKTCRLADCERFKTNCCQTCQHASNSYRACISKDEKPWCSFIKPFDCYNVDKVCCQRCKGFKKDIFNCGYGDKDGWCQEYVKKIPSLCKSQSVAETCCETCAKEKKKKEKKKKGECEDENEENCKAYSAYYCYQSAIEKSCCATCKGYRKRAGACRYGDAAPWCATKYCKSKDSKKCCETCGNF